MEKQYLLYETPYDGERKIRLCVEETYGYGINIMMIDVTEEFYEPYCCMTVTLDFLLPGYGFVDTNNVEGIEKFIVSNGLGKFTGTKKRSGFCEYPLYQFNMDNVMQYAITEEEANA